MIDLKDNITATDSLDDYQPPSMSDKGNIIFEVIDRHAEGYYKGQWIIDNYSYDCGNAPFWIEEGMGVSYFVSSYLDEEELGLGWWVVEGLTCSLVSAGTWEYEEWDEEWDWELIRPATQDEIDKV